MSAEEVDRLKIMEQIKARKLTQREAARHLNLCREQVNRLYKRYIEEGAESLISKKRGCLGNNRIGVKVREEVVRIIREQYHDFGPTLAHEKLTEIHGFSLSDESVRKIMLEAEIWKGKKRKHPQVHQMRPRRPARGELIQIDGSPHDCV